MELEFDLLIKCLYKLDVKSTANWGKMNSNQMLRHCNNFIEVSLGLKKIGLKTKIFGKVGGKLFLRYLTSINFEISRYPRNSPTLKEFKPKEIIIDFEEETMKLVKNIKQIKKIKTKFTYHQIYGKITTDLFKKLMYFHTSYHLNQFGLLNNKS
tara:strand:- start:1942 stop:2403 length:462 start_codon:yes stop_codon:yes gene_type:complete